jgi:hypothetical protein
MKKGKIILSAAGLIVTLASAFAFKVQQKFNGGNLFTKTVTGGGVTVCTPQTKCNTGGTGRACLSGASVYTTSNCSGSKWTSHTQIVD